MRHWTLELALDLFAVEANLRRIGNRSRAQMKNGGDSIILLSFAFFQGQVNGEANDCRPRFIEDRA